jgi:glycosyltransferase involved in cell wall biosynthesis
VNSSLVSVVIPTYNYGHFLQQAIDSALAQNYQPCEIIVVDDGSTDNTSEVAARYGSRIRFYKQSNAGPASARNYGIQEARGEIIAFLDSDDVWHPRKIERQISAFRASGNLAMVTTALMPITDNGEVLLRADDIGVSNPAVSGITLRDLLEYAHMTPSSVLIPKKCFDVVGVFDDSLKGAEDMEMWCRVASHYPILQVRECLTGYRVHSDSVSYVPDRMLESHLRFLDKVFGNLEPLRSNRHWRRLAEARMYREIAFMKHVMRDRAGAAVALFRSIAQWPFSLRDNTGRKRRLQRLKQLVRYTLVPDTHPTTKALRAK